MEMAQVQCPVCGAYGTPGSFCEMGCGRLQSPSMPTSCAVCGEPRVVMTLPAQFAEGSGEQVTFAYGFVADIFERLEISVKDEAEELGRRCTERRPGRVGELRLNIQPRRAGHLVLTVEMACLQEGEAESLIYRSEVEVVVKPRLTNVTFNPTINISGNYGNDFAGARIGSLNLPEETAAGPVVKPLALSLVRMPGRVLLTSLEEKVQIFARDQITLGRARGNDVVLRVFTAAGQSRDDVSRRLSGTHARILMGRNGVELRDGGSRPSTNGTVVDGRSLPPGGASSIRSGSCEIGFGPGTEDLRLQMTVHADAFGRTMGCVLCRTDGARRRTLLVVREVPLDEQGTSLVWDGGLFAVQSPVGGRMILSPGSEVEFAGRRWRVEPFRPTWIHSGND